MLRPEWRLRPLSSFLGFLDIKTGVVVALLFALFNKVTGVYGLLAFLMGAGGSLAQLSMYVYSVLGLVALTWGLKAVQEEDPKRTLYFAHLFFADHILSTAWTVFFIVVWWVYTPHDGARRISSPAQEDIIHRSGINVTMSPEDRTAAAQAIWNKEKGPALAIVILGWLAKIYFALLLYSYASHLRKGSYRSLPLSRPNPAAPTPAYAALPDEEEGDTIDEFYRLPLRARPSSKADASMPDEVLFDEDEDRHSKFASTSASTTEESTTGGSDGEDHVQMGVRR
ncbi:DUF1753-domain-containing protein [Gloeophyllum trabeum ATCC 11539]|uniref:DUF1753-domain-containing protein n=1 Tax=Gloeophyllum trabeum (strain ATCC 11539 / FP-39264 / Madison 617) TaxID=670483 RepID=S7QB93_GLOTA|nr:DUF1753-domain-containing protein [Gloeophyllum trabeum ATCC 11539]EPQ56603.1 DUF1753-domain-containing protein [Gloeophyllum trabeum ATCC 11539]